ncbi:hypothetical protein NFJ02_03g101130 [Pycnococcus provasolii]
MMHVLKGLSDTESSVATRHMSAGYDEQMGDAGHIFDATELEIEVPTEKQAQGRHGANQAQEHDNFSRAFLVWSNHLRK